VLSVPIGGKGLNFQVNDVHPVGHASFLRVRVRAAMAPDITARLRVGDSDTNVPDYPGAWVGRVESVNGADIVLRLPVQQLDGGWKYHDQRLKLGGSITFESPNAVINGTGVGDADPNGTGLAWDGQYLWQNDHTDDRIYQLDPSDGSVIRSIPAPSTWAGGLGYHAGVLVYYDVAGGKIYQVDAADGTVLDSCQVPATQHWGMDVNDAGEVIDGGISFDKIYVMDADVGLFDNFCTSTVNSTGGAALLSGNGSPSIAENNLTLTAAPVPNQTFIFFFGPNQIQILFGNGWQCVGGGITRILPRSQYSSRRCAFESRQQRSGSATPVYTGKARK
jgi:hypothetical protein